MKEILRRLEKPFLITYISIWVAVYVLSRFFLEIYTDDAPASVWIFLLIVLVPLSFYAAARTVAIKRENWYGVIGYFIIYSAVSLLTSNYIIVNGDLLISAAIKPKTRSQVVVTDVHKVFYKSGFDHTSVTVKTQDRSITLQGRPYIFFYLLGKERISVSSARSFLANEFLYTDGISRREKLKARWLHIKDQIYRLRIIAAIIATLTLIGFLLPQKKFPNRQAAAKIGIWKMMAIVMGILLTLGLLFYAGLFVYVKYFATARH